MYFRNSVLDNTTDMKVKRISICGMLLFMLAYSVKSPAQEDTLKQAGYVYDHFISGIVLLKNGNRESAPLNYDANQQAIAFQQDKQFMTLTNVDDVDTVYIESAKFIPVKGLFYQLLNEPSSSSILLASYYCKPHPVTASVDHNGTSTQNKNVVSSNVSDAYLNRRYKGDFYMDFQKEYWLKIKGAFFRVTNEKQIRKTFPEKSDNIHAFVEQNKIDFKKEDDLLRLIQYCENTTSKN